MKNDTDIRFRLPAALKADAQLFCARNGVSVGEWLRALMQNSLDETHPARKRPRPLTLSDGTTLTRR